MFNILSGMEHGNIKSIPVAADTVLEAGDWVVITDGKLVKQAGAYAPATQGLVVPVFTQPAESFDNKYLQKADCMTAKVGIIETDKVAAVTIKAGDALTVKDAVLDKATADSVIVAYALKDLTDGVLQAVMA